MSRTTAEAAKAVIDDLRDKHLDWCDLAEHRATLPDEAGALKRVLGEPRFADSITTYVTNSRAAEGARDRHKMHATRAAVSGFLVAALGGVLLYMHASPTTDYIAFLIAAAQTIAIVVALYSALVITFAKPHGDWSRKRSKAEHQRLEHFRMLLSARAEPRAGELPLAPLALEYVRAFLLEDQRDWFARRAREYAPSVRRLLVWRILAFALIALAAVPAILAAVRSPLVDEALPALAAWIGSIGAGVNAELLLVAGIVGGALQTLMTSLAATSLANRNAETYERMAARLAALSDEHLERARADVATGDAAAMNALWSELAFELAAEHREWSAAHRTAQLLVLEKGPGADLIGR